MDRITLDLDFRSRQQLKGLYLITRLAQNLNETFLRQGRFENPHLIWSTSFIQAYFAAATLSSYNWQLLLETGQLVPWSAEMEESLSSTDKMKAMVKFCYDTMGDNAPQAFHDILAERLGDMNDPCTVLGTRSLAVSTENFQANFQDRFRQIIQQRDLGQDEHALLVYKLLRFIYSVYDNIFQGLTLISSPMDEYMALRFRIYSDVLLATCKLLFSAIEDVSNWRHSPVNVFNQPVHSIANKAVEESLLRNTRRSSILAKRNK